MIRDFGARGKIFEVHFRNVSGPLPRFVEAFPDDGYLDMYSVMKTLREVKFSGAAEPDHVPKLAGDTGILRAGTAYCLVNMRTLIQRADPIIWITRSHLNHVPALMKSARAWMPSIAKLSRSSRDVFLRSGGCGLQDKLRQRGSARPCSGNFENAP